ncbi:unnamed protein product [Wickerhamomyces anomalus]
MTNDIQLHDLETNDNHHLDKDHKGDKTTTTTTTILSPDPNESPFKDLETQNQYTPTIIKPLVLDKNFKITLTAVWIGNFLCSLDGTIVSTTMSNIASDFGQSHLVTWIAVSYLLTSTAFQPLYGILLSGVSTNVQTLSLARAISGIGGAGIYALATIIISDVVPLSHRSIFSAGGTIVGSTSQMLGGPIGGLCIATIGWRMMFLIQVPFIVGCIVLTWFCEINVEHIPDGPDRFSKENLKRIDFGGIITLNLIVSSVIFLIIK